MATAIDLRPNNGMPVHRETPIGRNQVQSSLRNHNSLSGNDLFKFRLLRGLEEACEG